jgi:hypothetical protein
MAFDEPPGVFFIGVARQPGVPSKAANRSRVTAGVERADDVEVLEAGCDRDWFAPRVFGARGREPVAAGVEHARGSAYLT